MHRNKRIIYFILEYLEQKLGLKTGFGIWKVVTYEQIFEAVCARCEKEKVTFTDELCNYAMHCVVQSNYVVYASVKTFDFAYDMDHTKYLDVAFKDITQEGHDFLEKYRKDLSEMCRNNAVTME